MATGLEQLIAQGITPEGILQLLTGGGERGLDTPEERKYQTKITIDVLGYVIGEGDNQKNPKIVIRENAVEVKIPREHVILGDIDEYLDDRGFYRE